MDDALGLPRRLHRESTTKKTSLFYNRRGFIYHIDDGAVAALTEFYRAALPRRVARPDERLGSAICRPRPATPR